MPHQPRSFAPTFGDHPPGYNPPTTDRPEGDKRRKPEKPERRQFGERLSIRTYEPDPESVIRALFGKEVETDARTGELVPAERK